MYYYYNLNEMNNIVFKLEIKLVKKCFRYIKFYWNDYLMDLWENMLFKEKEFFICDGNCNMRVKLCCEYIWVWDLFNKILRWIEWEDRWLSVVEIENMCMKNLNDFWVKICNFGLKKKYILFEIIDEMGMIIKWWGSCVK